MPTIEALSRGLDVLVTLTKYPLGATLATLHRSTPLPIPKPSLLAILETLEEGGVVSRQEQHWQLADTYVSAMLGAAQERVEAWRSARGARRTVGIKPDLTVIATPPEGATDVP